MASLCISAHAAVACDADVWHRYDLQLAAALQRHDDNAVGRLSLAEGRYADSCAWSESGIDRYNSLRTGASDLGAYGGVEVGQQHFTPTAKWALQRAIAMLYAIKNDPNLPGPVDWEIALYKRYLSYFPRQ